MRSAASPPERLEGRSLVPFLHGNAPAVWRDAVFSEYDYSTQGFRALTPQGTDDARIVMAMTDRWKYIVPLGYRPLLFDLENDAREFHDLGADPAYESVRTEMAGRLWAWALRSHQRTTVSRKSIDAAMGQDENLGFLIGYWDEEDLDDPANVPSPRTDL